METLSKFNFQLIHSFLLYICSFLYNEVGTGKFPLHHEFPLSMASSQLILKKFPFQEKVSNVALHARNVIFWDFPEKFPLHWFPFHGGG